MKISSKGYFTAHCDYGRWRRVLAGCSPEPAPANTTLLGLRENYPDSLTVRNLLLVGTLKLEDTDLEVTPEQAAALVPLWQAMKA